MSSSSRRPFYDPKNPRLLSEEEISGLSAAECDAACLQIDQILVSVLQNIDADFGRCHRTITDKILPDLEKHGEASRGVWEGLKFWQGFFEASANVRLSDSNNDTTGNTGSFVQQAETNEKSRTAEGEEEEDMEQEEKNFEPSGPAQESRRENFQKNVDFNPEASGSQSIQASDSSNNQGGSTTSLRRPPHWHDLSMDSPDTTLQALPAQELSPIEPSSVNTSMASGISLSLCAPSTEGGRGEEEETPKPETSAGTSRGPMLLHKALMRDMMTEKHKRRTISTPAKPSSDRVAGPSSFPPEVADPSWNGITDLRKAPLDSFASPVKQIRRPHVEFLEKSSSNAIRHDETEESPRAGISPPQTIHFSVPRSKLAQTPSKEAARLITRDVLETARFRAGYENPTDLEDSPPLEPPSVLREWKTRGYESLFKKKAEDEDRGSAGDGKLPESKPESILDKNQAPSWIPGSPRDVSRSLIDLRGSETSSRQFGGPSEESHSGQDPFSERPTNNSRESRQPGGLFSKHSHQSSQTIFGRGDENAKDSPTLFGIRKENKRPNKNSGPSNSFFSPVDSSLTEIDPDRPTSRNFVPMKPDEMDTYYGGNLLDGECFEPSPLQGKRIKYSDPKGS